MTPLDLASLISDYIKDGQEWDDISDEEALIIIKCWAKWQGKDIYLDCIRELPDGYFTALRDNDAIMAGEIYNTFLLSSFNDEIEKLWDEQREPTVTIQIGRAHV